jgi:hypothetical protein
MVGLDVNLRGDAAFPELAGVSRITAVLQSDIKPPTHMFHLGTSAPTIQLAVLEGGTAKGLPSVVMKIDLPDGQVVLAETTARLFCTAGRMITAKYPALFEGE